MTIIFRAMLTASPLAVVMNCYLVVTKQFSTRSVGNSSASYGSTVCINITSYADHSDRLK
jgi:hypothetical protein